MDEIKPKVPEGLDGEEAASDAVEAWGLLMQALRDEKVLKALRDSVGDWKTVQDKRTDKQFDAQVATTGKQYVLAWIQTLARYALSGVAVWAVVHLGMAHVLEPQALAVLLGGVVGSLFVQPRSVENKK